MDPTTLAMLMQSMGWGAYVPVALAVIGLFSAVATVYQPTWPGAAVVHRLALLIGRAKPATPATATPTEKPA